MTEVKIRVMALIWSMGAGGAQQIVLNNLLDFQNDQDIEFRLFVFCRKSNSKYDRIISEKGLPVTYLGYPQSRIRIPYVRGPLNIAVARKAWKKAIEEYKPDIIHVHISELLYNTLDAIIQCNVPVRFDTLHSAPERYHGKHLKAIRKAFQKADFIPLCLTVDQAQRGMQRYGFHEYEVLHNGVDFKNIQEKIITRNNARIFLNIPENAFVIAGVGRLDPIKNYPLMLKIMSVLLKTRDNAVLLIAGDGPDRDKIISIINEYGISKNVRLLGKLDDVIPLYCASDRLLITSESEASSLVLLEAQCCRLRCIISAGTPEESIITQYVRRMNTNSSIQDWVDATLDDHYEGEAVCTEKDYEVHAVSDRLKSIYLKYWSKYKNEKK